MPKDLLELLNRIGGWDGFEIADIQEDPRLQHFARRLRVHVTAILHHGRFPLNTALVEGINNKIKVIKRMAYGFRDDAYFFLKIRAAFPGIR